MARIKKNIAAGQDCCDIFKGPGLKGFTQLFHLDLFFPANINASQKSDIGGDRGGWNNCLHIFIIGWVSFHSAQPIFHENLAMTNEFGKFLLFRFTHPGLELFFQLLDNSFTQLAHFLIIQGTVGRLPG
jgi:hypothetical protein